MHFKFRCIDIVEVSSRKGLKAAGPRVQRQRCASGQQKLLMVLTVYPNKEQNRRNRKTKQRTKWPTNRNACVLMYMHKSNET